MKCCEGSRGVFAPGLVAFGMNAVSATVTPFGFEPRRGTARRARSVSVDDARPFPASPWRTSRTCDQYPGSR